LDPVAVSLAPAVETSRPESRPERREVDGPEQPRRIQQVRAPKLALEPAPAPDVRLDMPRLVPEVDAELAAVGPLPDVAPPKAATAPAAPEGGGFELAEVDRPPRVVRKTAPRYPLAAKRRDITGSVVVRFLVDPEGRVRDVSVVRSEPEGVFERSVLQCLPHWRFKPGYLDGRPVPTWVVLPVRFDVS
jgi:protein TonB